LAKMTAEGQGSMLIPRTSALAFWNSAYASRKAPNSFSQPPVKASW